MRLLADAEGFMYWEAGLPEEEDLPGEGCCTADQRRPVVEGASRGQGPRPRAQPLGTTVAPAGARRRG